jgi:prevent-host-death family protein
MEKPFRQHGVKGDGRGVRVAGSARISNVARVSPAQFNVPVGAALISGSSTYKLNRPSFRRNLVSMTRLSKSRRPSSKPPKPPASSPRSGYWLLQDAKARFSELVRKVRSEGPQHVTVHGREEVVVIAADEFRRLKGSLTGQALITAMQASPHREIDIEPKRGAMPVRDVLL